MRRIAVLSTLAAALTAVSSAGAAFRPVNRDFGERVLPRVRAGTIRAPSGQAQARVRVIVRLAQPPLAAARGSDLVLGGTSAKLDLASAGAKAYLARLARAQTSAVAQLERAIPQARVDRRFRLLLDGITVTLPDRDLPKLVRLGFVDRVYPSLRYAATLDTSPQIIGAPQLTQATGDGGQGIKVGVVDTGVDATNPFFDPTDYTYPAGFPRGQTHFVSPKVIVARSFPGPGSGEQGSLPFVEDEFHGTHVAGIAAGNAGTKAPASEAHPAVAGLSGVAPKAWIGNYRVFTVPTPVGRVANTPEIVAAFESAVADGMDVINFSGGGPQTEPANDPLVEVVHNVAAAGVVPVIAAGNDRDDFGLGSVGSPGTAPDAISVAAVTNSHIFAQALSVTAPNAPSTLTQIAFEGADGQPAPTAWASADQTLVDVRSVVGTDGRAVDASLCAPGGQNPNALASTLPSGSLAGAVVLVARGRCSFTSKALRAEAAGAKGLVLVDNRAGDPNTIPVDMPIPSGTISDLDGARLEAFLTAAGGRTTIRVGRDISEILDGRSGVVTSFSSAGPTDFGHQLKPDVAAPGSQILSSTPPAATRSTFFVLDGTSMATPHVSGAAALLLERHPDWTPQQVKSALVSTGVAAFADTARTTEASVLLEGGGLVDVRRADDPGVFTDPTSLSFGDVNVSRGARTKPMLVAISDAGNGSGEWQLQVQPQTATAGVSIDVQTTVTLTTGATAYVPIVARAAADATPGDEAGFVVLRKGAIERRLPYFFLVTRPGLPLAATPVPLQKEQVGDTRQGVSHVGVYRYPLWPFGPPPTYSGPGMDERGSEHVYRVDIDEPTVNVGVSVLAASADALIHPWFLGSLDENDVEGYAGTPVDVNDFTFDSRLDIGAAGVIFPRQQSFYAVVDSGTLLSTGEALPGRYLLNAWVDDVTPPTIRLVTKRVAAGRPLLVARVQDGGSGVDPFSLVLAYKRVLIGAVAYDPFSGYALFPLPAVAPKLPKGATPSILVGSDYQEAKNIDTLGHEVLPNTTFRTAQITAVNGPAVTWLLPESGPCLTGRVVLTVTASSTARVRSVRFRADGRPIAAGKGADGLYSNVWNTATVAKGRHVLRAVVTDSAGRSAATDRRVRICRGK